MNTRDARVALFTLLAGCSSNAPAPNPNTNPSSVAGPKAYVGLFGDKSVAVLDMLTQQVLTTIPVTAPDGLVITPDGKKVYVSSADSGQVQVIDTTTDAVVRSVPVGVQPQGLSITPDGARVVVAVQGDGQAALIDTATDAVIGDVAIGKPHSSGVTSDGKRAYVGSQVTTAPALVLVDLASGAAGATITVDKPPRAIAAAPWGKIYFSVVGSDALEVIDATTGQARAPIATGGSPHDTRPTLDGSMELVVSQTAGDLEVIDPTSDAVTAKIPTGKMPHWIALASDGRSAYVTNEGDDDVVVIDLALRAIVQTIPIGKAPRKIAIQR